MKADVQPILQVKEIYKRFGGLVAVDHVSLDIYPGEVVGLLGDNGAGKSTLIKMISGAYKPDGGDRFFSMVKRYRSLRRWKHDGVG